MYILSTFANEIRGRCQILWRGKQGGENGPNLNLKRIQFRRKRKIFLFNFHSSLFRLRIEWFILPSHVLIEKMCVEFSFISIARRRRRRGRLETRAGRLTWALLAIDAWMLKLNFNQVDAPWVASQFNLDWWLEKFVLWLTNCLACLPPQVSNLDSISWF